MPGRDRAIPEGMHPFDQLVSVNRRAVADGLIDRPSLEGLPGVLGLIERRVENSAMGVQLGVERAGGRVREPGGHQVARRTVSLSSLLADTGGRKGFEFPKRNRHGLLVPLDQPLIVHRNGQH